MYRTRTRTAVILGRTVMFDVDTEPLLVPVLVLADSGRYRHEKQRIRETDEMETHIECPRGMLLIPLHHYGKCIVRWTMRLEIAN